MLRRVRTASSLLFLVGAVGCFGEANAQGDVFACCGGNGPVTYGRSCDNISDDDAVQSGAQLVACWKHALAHFRNNTLDPDLHGVTIASQYQFFTIVLSSKNPVITPPPTANGTAVLQFSAEHDVGSRVMPDQNPGLGLRILFAFPQDAETGKCLPLDLAHWTIGVSLGAAGTGAGAGKNRNIPGMGLFFDGCGRDESVLTNLTLSALGYGQPSFWFVTLRDSPSVAAAEASQHVDMTGFVLLFICLFRRARQGKKVCVLGGLSSACDGLCVPASVRF